MAEDRISNGRYQYEQTISSPSTYHKFYALITCNGTSQLN